MKILKKILTIIIVVFMIIVTLTDCSKKAVSTITTPGKPIKSSCILIGFY